MTLLGVELWKPVSMALEGIPLTVHRCRAERRYIFRQIGKEIPAEISPTHRSLAPLRSRSDGGTLCDMLNDMIQLLSTIFISLHAIT